MKDKKQIAAIAGVVAYLASETPQSYPQRPLENAPSLWQQYGRQQTMQYRDLIQRRIIKRHR